MRNYKRKTTRGSTSEEVYELAAKEVLENKKSLREAARSFEICHVTLHTFMKKKKEGLSVELGYKKNRQVFNTQQEIKLAEYLVQCAVIYFGLHLVKSKNWRMKLPFITRFPKFLKVGQEISPLVMTGLQHF